MLQDDQGVPQDSPLGQQDVSADSVQPQDDVGTQELQTAPPSDEGQTSVQPQDDVDDLGVPFKNRYYEYKRKFEDLDGKFNQVLDRLNNLPSAGQQQQTSQYTVEELEAFVESPQATPEQKIWAKGQIRKLQREEQSTMLRGELQKWQDTQRSEMVKQQSTQRVLQMHPTLAVRDQNGNFLGWNERDPMYQRINYYMSDKELQNSPRGFEAAAALAFRDIQIMKMRQSQAKQQQLQGQVKNLQRQTMVEGAGKQYTPTGTPTKDALKRAKESGRPQEAEDAMGKILESMGVLPGE